MSTSTMDDNTPPSGSKWTRFVPSWVKLAVPLGMFAFTALGAAMTYGVVRGETQTEIRAHEARLDKVDGRLDSLARVEIQLAELRGEVKQIATRLGIATKPPSWIDSIPAPALTPEYKDATP